MKQVITIDKFGRPVSLRMPDGVGFDLRRLGPVTMTRISDILLDDEHQQFYVQFPDGTRLKGSALATNTVIETHDLFETYELAVQAEVEFYNQSKLK